MSRRNLFTLSLLIVGSLFASQTNAALIYGGATAAGSLFNPGVGAIAYMNCFTNLPGSQLTIDDFNVGIHRNTNAPAVTVNLYAAEMTFDGVNFGRGANYLVHTENLAAASGVLQTISTPLNLGTVLNLQTVSHPGLGGFWIGVEFSSASTLNGWRTSNLPTTGSSINGFGIFNNAGNGIFQALFAFGNPPGSTPSRFLTNVNGTVGVPEPNSILLVSCVGIVLTGFRRRKA